MYYVLVCMLLSKNCIFTFSCQTYEFRFYETLRTFNQSTKEFFRTCNVLPFNCTYLALQRQGKRPKIRKVVIEGMACQLSSSLAADKPLLFVTSKKRNHQFTNLKSSKKAREPFKTLFTLKKHFKPCFFILMALKDILQHFKFVNWRIGI